jgi:hypothetical protein
MTVNNGMDRGMDIVYRGANALGFVANVVSMGLPYASPERFILKTASVMVHFGSAALAGFFFNTQDTALKTIASGVGCLCDAALIQGINQSQSAHSGQRYAYEGYSATVHGLNAWQGLCNKAKPE